MTQKLVVIPIGLVMLLVLASLLGPAMQAMTTTASYSVAQQSSVALAAYETASIEVVWFEMLPTDGWREHDEGKPGPEGKPPRIPKIDWYKIWVLEELGRKVIELRGPDGQVLARVTWTLSNLTGFIDDWAGPSWAWSSKVEVMNGYGGNGIGFWLWKLSERLFYDPTVPRVIVDMSKTASGQTGWTTFNLPAVWEFVRANVGNFEVLYENTVDKIWVIQYAP